MSDGRDFGVSVVVERNVPCRMRDGVTLRGDLYRSAEAAPGPVLVHRTPYDKLHPTFVTSLMIHPFEAVDRGYAVYVQDVRGRFASDGSWTPIHCEREDGYDTVEWAAGQPWSNGRVGIYGSSYMGVTTLQAVAARPPHLGAAASYLTGTNYHDGFVYSGGAFELLFVLRWCAAQALNTLQRAGMPEADRAAARERLLWILDHPREATAFQPLVDVFGAADPLVPHWRTWLGHPAYDSLWEAADPREGIAGSGIPLLSIAGWFDGFARGAVDLHEAIGRARASGAAATPERLVLGPWDHEAYLSLRPTTAGDEHLGTAAACGQPGLSRTILDWFDRWLKEGDRSDEFSCRYFVIGPNEWRESPCWPPEGPDLKLYLSGSPANSSTGAGRLSPAAPQDATVNVLTHDPANPVPTTGGRHLGYWYGHAGILDQSAVERRDDVLVFISDVLERAVTLAGSVRAEIWVRSEKPTADIALKLVDSRPNGYRANVADGIRRVTGATPGEILRIEVDLWHAAYVFEAGHRIVLEVAASNFPRFDINDGRPSAERFKTAAPASPFRIEVCSDARHPSHVVLHLTETAQTEDVRQESA